MSVELSKPYTLYVDKSMKHVSVIKFNTDAEDIPELESAKYCSSHNDVFWFLSNLKKSANKELMEFYVKDGSKPAVPSELDTLIGAVDKIKRQHLEAEPLPRKHSSKCTIM